MTKELIIQGRHLTENDIAFVRHLLKVNPGWSRRRLSIFLCQTWDWRNGTGQIKDMACRSMMLKLEKLGLIILPARRQAPSIRNPEREVISVDFDQSPIESSLRDLQPITITKVEHGTHFNNVFTSLVHEFHYLGYKGSVGENMKYLIHDNAGRVLSCLLFGSSAWSVQCRDVFIGWTAEQRRKNLPLLTNNMRFLIVPWVRVSCLASHILSKVSRLISHDWHERYGHPIFMLETFVQKDRFVGTCYKAANWIHVGQTTGRSRNSLSKKPAVPIKDVYLYPLLSKFQKKLMS